jgi:TolA-binding protein
MNPAMSFSQRCRLTPSYSMPAFGSIWSPSLLSGSLLEQAHHPKVTTFVTTFNALRVQLSYLKHRIYDMETENNELRHDNMILLSDSQALEQELSNFRADYYTERFQSKIRVQCARADKDRIIILSDKLEQAEKFIMAMVDIKLHEPVLGRAAEAVKEGADAEEALIDAVRAAATKKGSAWSRIIPAIVGPRSPEHYLSAINLALMLQKDLHESEKISNFWKTIAKLDPVNADTITPSPSLLSEVGGQDVEHSRSEQAVLDEMIALLTNGETLFKKTEVVQSAVTCSAEVVELAPTKAPQTVKIAGVSPPKHISQIPVSPLHSNAKALRITQSKVSSPVSPSKALFSTLPARQVSPPSISSKQPVTPIRKAPLTPIRSRLSTPRTNTFRRPALTTIDTNRPPVKMNTSKSVRKPLSSTNIPDDTIRKAPTATRDESKTLVKRRGVLMEEISHSPPVRIYIFIKNWSLMTF